MRKIGGVMIVDARIRQAIARSLTGTACIFLLSGCVALAVETLKIVYADPRSKIHAYDMRVEMSFHLGDMLVRSVQYGDVYYFEGQGEYSYPTCDKTKKSCWAITPEYFIVLANGDIARVQVDKNVLSLSDMPPGSNVRVKGVLSKIAHSQPRTDGESPRCESLNEADLAKFYGLQVRSHPGLVDRYIDLDIEILATRGAETEKRHRIFDPVDYYEAWSSHSCEQIAKRIPTEPQSP